MGRSNGIISTPINIETDIAYLLGESTGDWGTLCSSPLINKWAKYKPTATGIIPEPRGTISDEIRSSVHWGLTVSASFTNLANLVNRYASSYTYTHPTWYRIFDFIQCANGAPVTTNPKGYYHYAKSFVSGSDVVTNSTNKAIYYIRYDHGGIKVTVNWRSTNSGYEVGLDDLMEIETSFGNMYFGVVLVDTTASTYRLIVSAGKIGSEASYSTLAIPDSVFMPQNQDLSDHNFSIYPIISESNQHATPDDGGLVPSGDLGWNIYALPDVTPFAFQVVNAGTCYMLGDITNFSATYDIHNVTTARLSIPFKMDLQVVGTKDIGVRVRIWNGTKDPDTDTADYTKTTTLTFTTGWLTYSDVFDLGQLGADTLKVRVDSADYAISPKNATCTVESETGPIN